MRIGKALHWLAILGVLALTGCTTPGFPTIVSVNVPGTVVSNTTVTVSVTVSYGGGGPLVYEWSATCGGTFSPNNSPAAQTSTWTVPTVLATTPCTVTVRVTTRAGRSTTGSATTTVLPLPAPSLPACSMPRLTGQSVPSGSVNNHPITGAVGDRASVYVETTGDSTLHLRPTPLASPLSCPDGPPPAGDDECDDDDGPSLSSVIGLHPLSASSSYAAVHGYGGGALASYTLYRHVVPAASLVDMEAAGDAPGPNAGVDIPTTAPWIIAGEISPAGDQDWYRFFANAGDIVWAVLDGTPLTRTGAHNDDGRANDLRGILQLFTDTGALLVTANSNNTAYSGSALAETFVFTINVTGNYFVGVSGEGAETHAYHLVICRAN